MYWNPYATEQLVRERYEELLRMAEQERLARIAAQRPAGRSHPAGGLVTIWRWAAAVWRRARRRLAGGRAAPAGSNHHAAPTVEPRGGRSVRVGAASS